MTLKFMGIWLLVSICYVSDVYCKSLTEFSSLGYVLLLSLIAFLGGYYFKENRSK